MSGPSPKLRSREAILVVVTFAGIVLTAGGCGSSSSSDDKSGRSGSGSFFSLTGFEPAGPVEPGKPATLSFSITQPSGKTLKSFRTGPGPHTGVHLVIVRNDLGTVIHRQAQIAPDGTVRQAVVLPSPGPYTVLVDAYPRIAGGLPFFQLKKRVEARGAYRPRPIPPPTRTTTVNGYRFELAAPPRMHAIEPATLRVDVRDPQGRRPVFSPVFGALAHAFFFRARSLDYFHTHVCAPRVVSCTSTVGGPSITGTSTAPGKLTVAALFPVAGTWRLFLQSRVGRDLLTAPFTLKVGR